MEAQTSALRAAGCTITSLDLCPGASVPVPTPGAAAVAFAASQIVVVSGGNSLYMCDTWVALGIDALIRSAIERGTVFAGGSAGLGFLFQGIHSDSADPSTYRNVSDVTSTAWKYIRVPALGILPGLCCPHYDQIQSNGVLRAVDAAEMLLRHKGERMLCVDHWAALKVEGQGKFSVLCLPGKERSKEMGSGLPRISTLDVTENGTILEQTLPQAGNLADWLRESPFITHDDAVETCRRENPILH